MATTTKVTIMQRALPRLTHAISPLFALLLASHATAQQTSTTPAPATPARPPATQSVEPGSDTPATDIPTRRGTQIVEHRDGGAVTEVDVTAGGSHYTMRPNTPPGNAVPGSNANSIRAPQWTVGTFDLSGKRHGNADSGTNAPANDAPPPPPMQPGASQTR
jgi:hypothetical protein